MKRQKYLCSFLLTTSFISASAVSRADAPDTAAPKVDPLGLLTSALVDKSAKLASETKEIKEKKQKAAERLKVDREEDRDRSLVEQTQSTEAQDLYTKFKEEKNRISVISSTADTKKSTIDDEDLDFKALMGEHEREKQAIVEKEALYQRMDVQFSDNTVITVRRDVLNLCPRLKEMLESGVDEEKPLPFPDTVSHAAAQKLFSFLEATLTPEAKRPSLWSVPKSDTVIDFLKINKDLIFTLNFLQLLPKEYYHNLNNPRRMYMFKYFEQDDDTPYPQYLQDGFKYDPSVRPTAETMQFIIEEEALRDYPAIEQSEQRAFELYIKTLDDMKVILSFPVEILQEAFHIHEVILIEPDPLRDESFFSLTEKITKRNFDFKYRGEAHGVPLSLTDPSSADLVMNFHLVPEGPFKKRMVDKLLEAQDFSIYYYQMHNLNGLPENVLTHLKKVMTIYASIEVLLNEVPEILKKPEATRTQGENLLIAHYHNVSNSWVPQEVSISTIRDLENLDQLPPAFLQRLTFIIIPRVGFAEQESAIVPNMSTDRVQSLLRDLYTKHIRFKEEYRKG